MAAPIDDLGLYVAVLQVLEHMQVPYMVVGGFAAILYGVNRSTYDIDITPEVST